MSDPDRKKPAAESAGSGATEGAAKDFDPNAEAGDAAARSNTPEAAPAGIPVSEAEYRALKQRARTRHRSSANRDESVAQEDRDGCQEERGEEEKP